MRLTLRTLLAWLDDTLHPTQVTEIGKQVAESPFAQELSERIHRVTRQRRLTVPPSSGPDGTDANVVAAYLDNDLDPEAVAEYEKKCLSSDVNLAEAASVHQILSLLGQKVKVPAEARARMYQLVKGREAISSKRPQPRAAQPLEPVTRPIAPWVVHEAPRNFWLERVGPLGVCLLLLLLAGWSAMRSLSGRSTKATNAAELIAQKNLMAAAKAEAEKHQAASEADNPLALALGPAPANETVAHHAPGSEAEAPVPGGVPNPASPEAGAARAGSPDASRPAASKDSAKSSRPKEPAAPLTVPAGAAGVAEAPDGILLRYDPDRREWIRLLRTTPLAQLDRLLSLAPFRATIGLEKVRISLLGETQIRVLSRATDKTPSLELVQGRLLVRLPDSAALKVGPSERAVTLEASQDSVLGLERVDRRDYGQPVTKVPPLVIYCASGDVTFSVERKNDTLTGSSVVVVDPSGQFRRTKQETLPSWVTEAEPSAVELQLRDQFVRMFHPGRPVLAEIVAASEDERADIKKLSIGAIKALGELTLLMPLLSRPDDALSRRSAQAAVRAYMGQGPEAAGRMREQLVQEFGDDLAALADKMLIGFTAEEASNPTVFQRLVELMAPEQPSIGVRELALDTLKRLTGRDDLGYNADRPEGKALTAWRELLRRGELRPLPRPPRAE
jgi:hypothetical protein